MLCNHTLFQHRGDARQNQCNKANSAHPQKISEFRPISCCNVIYKCISKLQCLRIKEVPPCIINPRCILKIDLQKAFDSVQWGFIQEVFLALKFPPIFTSWIRACVSSVHFQVHINGQDHGSFKGGRD